MRKAVLFPALAAGGGLIGFFLRYYQSKTAFEPETGLLIPAQPVTLALLLLGVLMTLVLILLPGRTHRPFTGGYDAAFHSPLMPVLMLMTASVFLLAGAGFLHIRLFLRHEGGIIEIALGLLCLIAACSVLFLAKNNRRNEGRGNSSVWVLFPGFAGCLFMMSSYQSWAQDPVLSDYVFSLLAILGATFSSYLFASFAFERPRVRLSCTVALCTLCFGITAFADGLTLPDAFLLGGLLLYIVAAVFALLQNDALPEPPSSDSELPLKEDTI